MGQIRNLVFYPIGSMGRPGIFTYIYIVDLYGHVGKYTSPYRSSHGSVMGIEVLTMKFPGLLFLHSYGPAANTLGPSKLEVVSIVKC